MQASGGPGDIRGVVAVGGSAGGVEAMAKLVSGLSEDLPFAYLIVLHMPPRSPSVLGQILDRSGPLPAMTARTGAPLQAGHIYVSAPDRHLLVDDHLQLLSEGPTENGHRPAINALFRSVAVSFGARGIGVLLSGVLDDGVLGLAAIRSRGGTTISQTPDDALFPALPTKALHAGVVDYDAAAADMGALLRKLAKGEMEEADMRRDPPLEAENLIAARPRFATDFDTKGLGPADG